MMRLPLRSVRLAALVRARQGWHALLGARRSLMVANLAVVCTVAIGVVVLGLKVSQHVGR